MVPVRPPMLLSVVCSWICIIGKPIESLKDSHSLPRHIVLEFLESLSEYAVPEPR